MILKPTKEQENIFEYVKKRPENILIKAYAGTGKTVTIIHALNYIPKDKSITFLAFNRHIKEELVTKVPSHVRCYTTYGLGLSALKRTYSNIEFDEFRVDKVINKLKKDFDFDCGYEDMLVIKKLANLCRSTLSFKKEQIENLLKFHDFPIKSDKYVKPTMMVLDFMVKDRTTYDYLDMIFIPAMDTKVWFYGQDYIIVDEVQDISFCQIRIIEKALKKDKKTNKTTGRLISVGDAFQNVYAFNGANDLSFKWFEKLKNTKVLPLSISFRCSENVIKKAQTIVPDIKARENAPQGSVVYDGDVLKEATDGDFVLCRTTAPLVELFFDFLDQDKKATIKGSDIGLSLIELIGNITTIPELINYWEKKISDFNKELKKEGVIDPEEHTGYATMNDKFTCLGFLAKKSTTITNLKENIKKIFSDDVEGIMLSTIHKAKGLEADRVFIIKPELIPHPKAKGWWLGQEKNLEYIAITRAKTDLIYDRMWGKKQPKT